MLGKYLLLCLLVFLLPNFVYSKEDNQQLYSTDWFSNNIPNWEKYKEEFYNKSNKHCLEIGSWEGKSSIYIIENFCNGKGSRLDCVDIWDVSGGYEDAKKAYQKFLHNTNKYIKNKQIIPYKGFSQIVLVDLLHKIQARGGHKYDFIYIDGSHRSKDVFLDTALAWELLKVGGILMFDDYNWGVGYTSPKPAIDGFLASYESMYEVLHKDYQVFVRKISDRPKCDEVYVPKVTKASNLH